MFENLVNIDIISIALICLGLYFAIKYGVKQALIEYEASKEKLIEIEQEKELQKELMNRLGGYALPGGLPKSMPKDERRALRKKADKITIKFWFSNYSREDIEEFNLEAKNIIEQVQQFPNYLQRHPEK